MTGDKADDNRAGKKGDAATAGRRHEGRTALVTGAGSGIGRAVAVRLAREGAAVVVLDADPDGAAATVALVARAGGRAMACVADVRDPQAVGAAVRSALARFGALHVLVSNAGVFGDSVPFLDVADDTWDRVMGVNVHGAYVVAKAVLPHIVAAGGGSVVVVASTAAHVVGGGGAAYTTSKHALLGFARHLAVDCAPLGIRVNAVCPGAVNTALTNPIWRDHPEALARYSAVPAGRIGEPGDVASLVSFLASDEAGFMYGAGVVVDGGLTLT